MSNRGDLFSIAIGYPPENFYSLNMNRSVLLHTLAVLMFLSGCALDARYPQALDANSPKPAATSEIDHRLILIGDAGAVQHGDPVMTQLTRVASELDSEDVTIVFLGDNIYDHGLPPPDHDDYEWARTRLEIQIDAALASGATTVFIPGNHDDDIGGRKAVTRQAQYIRTYSKGRSALLPGGSCPGPIVQDRGEHLRVIYTDSQWLLKQKSPHPCAGDDPYAGIDTSRDFYQTTLALPGTRPGAPDADLCLAPVSGALLKTGSEQHQIPCPAGRPRGRIETSSQRTHADCQRTRTLDPDPRTPRHTQRSPGCERLGVY
jgi:hypothetical protein